METDRLFPELPSVTPRYDLLRIHVAALRLGVNIGRTFEETVQNLVAASGRTDWADRYLADVMVHD